MTFEKNVEILYKTHDHAGQWAPQEEGKVEEYEHEDYGEGEAVVKKIEILKSTREHYKRGIAEVAILFLIKSVILI